MSAVRCGKTRGTRKSSLPDIEEREGGKTYKLDPPTEGAMADEDDFEPVVKNFLNLISLMKLENSFNDQKNKNNTA